MNWSEKDIINVWRKATIVNGYDPAQWRKDRCGAWIGFIEFGDRDSKFGWEIDHIIPGAGHHLGNLQPLNWRNNVAKGDGRLQCPIRAIGDDNFLFS